MQHRGRQVCLLPTRIALSYLTLWVHPAKITTVPGASRSRGLSRVRPTGKCHRPFMGPGWTARQDVKAVPRVLFTASYWCKIASWGGLDRCAAQPSWQRQLWRCSRLLGCGHSGGPGRYLGSSGTAVTFIQWQESSSGHL